MDTQRSVFYRPTGRFTHAGQRPDEKAFEIVRNNEIYAPEFLRDTRGRSIFKNGDMQSGADTRLNAVGDTIDSATGYQIQIDTLTYIIKQVTMQKFYEFAFGEMLPVSVGEGSFASSLLFNRQYMVAEDFEAGNIRQGNANTRLSAADVALDGVSQLTQFWNKDISYTLIEIEQALRANSWDPLMGKHSARKKNWDLGMQITSMLGLQTDSRFPGLLTNPNVNTNTAIITKYISSMTAAELATFIGAFIPQYFTNTNSTAMPDTLVMPYVDYMGCCGALVPGTVGTYPVQLIDYLQKAFALATRNPGFKIIPLAYADKTVNNGLRGLNKNYYALYRNDPESLRMNIPLDYTVTQANSINNFQFQDAAYGQYTGVVVLRNLELLLFTF